VDPVPRQQLEQQPVDPVPRQQLEQQPVDPVPLQQLEQQQYLKRGKQQQGASNLSLLSLA